MNLHFFGDIYLDKKYDIDFPINNFIFNLEYSISIQGTPTKNKVNLIAEEMYIYETFGKKPNAVCLANNHIMDNGVIGFNNTLSHLDIEQIEYFGAGEKKDNYHNPLILDHNNKKIALLGYVCPSTHPAKIDDFGVAELEINNVLQDIKDIKKKVDFIVLQFHWGMEEIPFPKYTDVKIAHQCINSGADMIIGHHPHVMQSYEIYKGKYIFYSLGNFIFPDLDVPSNYNGETFTDRYRKKQELEHRQSIVVSLDNELNVDFFTVELKKGIVRQKKAFVPKWIPDSENSFHKRLIYQQKMNMIKKFIRNPKLPSLDHFKRFLGVRNDSKNNCNTQS